MALHFVQVEKGLLEGGELETAADKLGIDEDAVLGKSVRAWAWSLSNAAPEGLVEGPSAVRIVEKAAGWTGEKGAFVRSLPSVFDVSEAGVRFRGWTDRYGKTLEDRKKDADRKRIERELASSGGTSTRKPPRKSRRTSAGHPSDAPPDSSRALDLRPKTGEVRNQTEDSKPPPAAPSDPPSAEVVVEMKTGLDIAGCPVRREVVRVRWDHTIAGLWQMIQLLRVSRSLGAEQLAPEDFNSWAVQVLVDHEHDHVEPVIAAFLDDQTIRAKNHPTSVLIACWPHRCPPTKSQGEAHG